MAERCLANWWLFNLLTMKTYLDQHLRVLSAPSLTDYVAGKIEAYGVNGSALVLEAAVSPNKVNVIYNTVGFMDKLWGSGSVHGFTHSVNWGNSGCSVHLYSGI